MVFSPKQTPTTSLLNSRIQPVEPARKAGTESVGKDYAVNVSTPPITHVSIGSPAQSDLPTMTNWDEWDDPSDTGRQFDPTAGSADIFVVHYDPLLWIKSNIISFRLVFFFFLIAWEYVRLVVRPVHLLYVLLL